MSPLSNEPLRQEYRDRLEVVLRDLTHVVRTMSESTTVEKGPEVLESMGTAVDFLEKITAKLIPQIDRMSMLILEEKMK